jgi:hypothetical protein
MPTICTRGGSSSNARVGWAVLCRLGYETLTIRRSQGARKGAYVSLFVKASGIERLRGIRDAM